MKKHYYQRKLFYFYFIFLMGIHQIIVSQTFTLTCNQIQIPVMEQNDVDLSYKLNAYKYCQLIYEGKPLKFPLALMVIVFCRMIGKFHLKVKI